ncbi:MAG: helix-turn-helix transcriptional regulator, partial [Oscillospiraceae bacterium]|nr:helix-turn-helix transcriptional regulator [Oscillospiraceae bacterium]
MLYPQFTISRFGYYESGAEVRTEKKSRLCASYEFEFYTEDFSGGRTINGEFYPARKGCMSLSKPGQHQIMVRPYKCYFININTQDLELCELFNRLPPFFMLQNAEEVTELFHMMLALEAEKGALENRLLVQSYASRLVALLARYYYAPKVAEHALLRHQKMLLDADQYMREHLSEDLSLETLAKRSNLQPSYFHKLFTAAFGVTPANRVLGYRISAAKKALVEGVLPLVEIAAQCGFSSQTYFCYRFRKVTGQTPA